MTRVQALFVVAAALIISPFLLPARASVPQQVKVGVVDFEKTMMETPAGKRAGAAVTAAKKAKQDEFDKRKSEFLAKNADFEKQKGTLKPEDAQARSRPSSRRSTATWASSRRRSSATSPARTPRPSRA